MAEIKTRQNDADVFEFINTFADTEQKRPDRCITRGGLGMLKEVCEKNLAPFASLVATTDVQAVVEHAWKCWTSAEYVKKMELCF